MRMKDGDLAALEKVARLKADLELRKYAALHRQATALDARIAVLEDEVHETATSWGMAASRAETKLVNTLTRAMVDETVETEIARRRIEPAHEAARQVAAKAWGRAEALAELRRRSRAATRAAADSRGLP